MSKKPVQVVAAVFYRFVKSGQPEVGLFRRGPQNSGAGSWEFPGGKVDSGETEILALEREIFEELGVRIKVEERIGVSVHDYGSKLIRLTAYFVTAENLNFQLVDHDAQKWVGESEIQIQELAPADRPLVAQVFQQLRRNAKPNKPAPSDS